MCLSRDKAQYLEVREDEEHRERRMSRNIWNSKRRIRQLSWKLENISGWREINNVKYCSYKMKIRTETQTRDLATWSSSVTLEKQFHSYSGSKPLIGVCREHQRKGTGDPENRQHLEEFCLKERDEIRQEPQEKLGQKRVFPPTFKKCSFTQKLKE